MYTWFRKYFKSEFPETVLNSILGYIILVLFLFLLSCCPRLYNFLTRWANQENIPTIKECMVEGWKEVGGKYKFYKVKIILNSTFTTFSRLSFFIEPTDTDDIFINKKLNKGVLFSSESENYLLLKNYKRETKELNIIALSTTDKILLEQYNDNKPIPAEECPFVLYVYGTKS